MFLPVDNMGLERFPVFQPVDISQNALFARAFKEDPPLISEFTFTNIFSWRQAYKTSVSSLDGFIILRLGSSDRPSYFPPIGPGDPSMIMEKVLRYEGDKFIRIPESVKELLEKSGSRFTVAPDRDNYDYLFRTSDLVSLAGHAYDGKRNLLRKFRASYEYEYVKLDASNVHDCLIFEEKWCSIKDCDGVKSLDDERRAIKEMVDNYERFSLIGGAIRVDGEIRAVAIAQRLNRDTMVLHVLKAEQSMTGLYQVMNNEFLSREAGQFRFVNMEQDLGVEGLRTSKLSYHPFKLINKYSVGIIGG